MKHTPGPWKADRVLIDNAPDRMMVHVAAWGGPNIADCGTFAECNPADAHLIAAAPEMYDALRMLGDAYDAGDDLGEYIDGLVQAALDQAEGR